MHLGVIGGGKIGGTIASLLEACAFCESVTVGDVRTDLKVDGLSKARVRRLDVKRRAALTPVV
jgi:hypothetical protein